MRSSMRRLAELPPRHRYLAGAALLLALYAAVAVVLAANRAVVDRGPLSFPEPARSEPLPGAIAPDRALGACFPERSRSDRFKVVGGLVDGRPYYACYKLYADDGSVQEAVVVDGEGYRVGDVRLLKRSGAWPWIGAVKSVTDLVVGVLGMVALLALFWLYYPRGRPALAAPGRVRGAGRCRRPRPGGSTCTRLGRASRQPGTATRLGPAPAGAGSRDARTLRGRRAGPDPWCPWHGVARRAAARRRPRP